jgi:hypothetical protein
MSLASLFKERLPINRKEVYYTATVLPCIVCTDSFAHIGRFWQLLNVEVPPINVGSESANIQFLTEYNAKQSIYINPDKKRFPLEVKSGETPDVLILIDGPSPLVVSIEAKMYDTVNAGELRNQLRLQYENALKPLASGIPNARLVQVALLPGKMQITAEEIDPVRLLRWEDILEKFADVASASYFCDMLGLALKHYDVLRNEKVVFHANMEAMMTGEEILKGYEDGTSAFRTMGCSGGIQGKRLKWDIASGEWRHRCYELSSREMPANCNWFAIEEFFARIRQINLPD